jgi:ferrochelatase
MTYKGNPNFDHRQQDRIGVLLVNLGTPDAPTPAALRRYLGEFLWDPRVVEIPRPLWWLILHGIILRVRPRKSARAYASVWTEAGSPLLVHTLAQRDRLREHFGDSVLVEAAMRYGNPSMDSALDALCDQGARKILVLPLYPQYCAATTASTFDALARNFSARRWLPELRFISHYHDFPLYIRACADTISQYWARHGKPDKLVFSYHGIPRRNLDLGDPYHCECHKTSRLLGAALGLAEDAWITTFQSRFGAAEWLQPYTDATLKALPGQGVNHVQVFCPGFAADCLETIEEIDVENRHYFLEAGGKDFHYIPALNASEAHIDALAALVSNHLAGWEASVEADPLRQQRAQALGAAPASAVSI